MILFIRFIFYIALALSIFFYCISLKYSYYFLIELSSPLRYELLLGHAVGFVYGAMPMLTVLGIRYFCNDSFNKFENKLYFLPLFILALSFLFAFLGEVIH